MAAITFDTHAFIKRLTAAGMPEPQAEVLAEEQARMIEDRLATKADLALLEKSMASRMETLELRLTIKLGALIGAGVAFLSATKFFGH
jgi:pseudouridine-5'-phosphate glycosidase